MGSHWLSEFKNMMEKFEKAYLLNGNEGHCSRQFTTICEAGVLQVPLSTPACEYSQPYVSIPILQPVASSRNAASIKTLSCGNLQWLPSTSPRRSLASSHASGCLCHPTIFSPQNTTFLTSQVRFCSLSLPLPGLLCPQIFAWLPPPRGSSEKTFSTTQTHLGTSTVYSLLAPHLFVEHICILTNYFSDNLFNAFISCL